MIKKNKHFSRAFTLIEIITALAIMAVGLLSILALFPVGFQASKKAADFSRVGMFAQEKIEEIRMKGFGDADSFNGDTDTSSDGLFTRTIAVTNIDSHLKEVTVSVTWNERGQTRQENFKTYLTN